LEEKLLPRHDVALFSIQKMLTGQQHIDFAVRNIMNALLNVHL